MFKMYASDSHSYTRLILALGIVREPTIWGSITSQYPGIHDIGQAMFRDTIHARRIHEVRSTCYGTAYGEFEVLSWCLRFVLQAYGMIPPDPADGLFSEGGEVIKLNVKAL